MRIVVDIPAKSIALQCKESLHSHVHISPLDISVFPKMSRFLLFFDVTCVFFTLLI